MERRGWLPHNRTKDMSTSDHEAQYEAWAARIKTRQEASVANAKEPQTPRGSSVDATSDGDSDHFDFDELSVGSTPRQQHEPAEVLTRADVDLDELLGTFGLREGATMEDVAAAYRTLVKALQSGDSDGAEDASHEGHRQLLELANSTYRSLARLLDGRPLTSGPGA